MRTHHIREMKQFFVVEVLLVESFWSELPLLLNP